MDGKDARPTLPAPCRVGGLELKGQLGFTGHGLHAHTMVRGFMCPLLLKSSNTVPLGNRGFASIS